MDRIDSGTYAPVTDTLHRNLLRYGRLAQIAFNYRMDSLPDERDATDLAPIPSGYAPGADPTTMSKYIAKFEAKIEMASSVNMNIYLTPAAGYSLNDFEITVVNKGTMRGYASGPVIKDGKIFIRIQGIM